MKLRTWLIAAGAVVVVGYSGAVGALYVGQRSLMYFPDPTRWVPEAAAVGLTQTEEVELKTSDGETLVAWHFAPKPGKPTVIYFPGRSRTLRERSHQLVKLKADGMGVLAVSYRGYGGSTGRPTEDGLMRDGEAAYQYAAARYPADRIAIWGESLGTGVAVAIAARHKVARLLLQSPYTSTVDVAAAIYWYAPVRLLMQDQFRSDLLIGNVTAPVLVIHGARDTTVPIRFGERLYEMIRAPKQFVRLPEAGHNDLGRFGAFDIAVKFLSGEAEEPR